MQVQSQAQAQVQAQAQAQVQVQAQARILLHPNSGEGPMGDLDTVRVGRYKAKFRTGGIATECPTAREGPRKAPLLYHDPPLLFDLASDPAERNNLAPSHPYYAAVLRVLLGARATATASVQSDELLSQVDWTEDDAMRACCDPTQHMCRCAPKPGAYPKREGITFYPRAPLPPAPLPVVRTRTRGAYSRPGRRHRAWRRSGDGDEDCDEEDGGEGCDDDGGGERTRWRSVAAARPEPAAAIATTSVAAAAEPAAAIAQPVGATSAASSALAAPLASSSVATAPEPAAAIATTSVAAAAIAQLAAATAIATTSVAKKGKGIGKKGKGKGKKGKGKGKGKGGYGAWSKPRSGKGKGYSRKESAGL